MYFEDSHYPRVSTNQTGPIYDVSRVIILSEMLCRCYVNDTVHFTDGILRLKDLLPQIRRLAVVFIDTVPDNFYTLRDYEDILRYVIDKSFYDLYIILIPCIEYFAIKCFGKDCPSKRTVINRLDYSEDIIAKQYVTA